MKPNLFGWALALTMAAVVVPMGGNAAKTKPVDNRTKVLFKTSMGNITIALCDETPQHRDNFIKLVENHTYDGLLFHRVIPNFMVQAGDPNSRKAPAGKRLGNGDVGYTIPAEIKYPTLFHKRGAVAAARKPDQVNPDRRSSGCQFYIVWGDEFSTEEMAGYAAQVEKQSRGAMKIPAEVQKAYVKYGGTPHLDGGYTVFGEVVDGMKVVDKIQTLRRDSYDRPFDDVVIISAEVLKK